MRIILILWIIPVVLFWGWYGLSANNMHFGMFFLSRGFHDHLFGIYGQILHMPPEEVPVKLAWLFGIDTLIVFGVAALRWHRKWLPQTRAWFRNLFAPEVTEQGGVIRVGIIEEGEIRVISEPFGPVQPAK